MRKILTTALLSVIIFIVSGCALVNDLSYKASHPLPSGEATLQNAQKFVQEHSDEYNICPNCGGTGIAKQWDTNFRDICRMCEGKGYVHK